MTPSALIAGLALGALIVALRRRARRLASLPRCTGCGRRLWRYYRHVACPDCLKLAAIGAYEIARAYEAVQEYSDLDRIVQAVPELSEPWDTRTST